MAAIGIGVAAASSLISGLAGAESARQQQRAAKKAQEEAAKRLEEERGRLDESQQKALTAIVEGRDEGIKALLEGRAGQMDSLSASTRDALGSLETGGFLAKGDIRRHGQVAREDVSRGFGQAAQEQRAGAQRGRDALGRVQGLGDLGLQAAQGRGATDVRGQVPGREGLVGSAQNRLAGLTGDELRERFKTDPGFEFRREQGEQAIKRATAARGGRTSGRALKELSRFNQDLASDEFSKFAQREMGREGAAGQFDLAGRQQDIGQRGQSIGQRGQDLSSLLDFAGRSDAAGSQTQGIQAALGQQGFGAFQQQAGFEQQNSSALAQLLANRGQSMAGLEQQLGSSLANIDLSTGQQRAGLQQQLGTNQANAFGMTAQQMANQFANAGSAQTSALQNFSAMSGNLTTGQANNAFAPVQFAGGQEAAAANTFNNLAGLAAQAGAQAEGGKGG